MLKRITLMLFIAVIIAFGLLYKIMQSCPDTLAAFTGKECLLREPFVKFVDIEKLYRLPDDNLDVQLLRAEIEEASSAVMLPSNKGRLVENCKDKLELLTGKRSLNSVEDAKYLFKASNHPYTTLNDNSELNGFFYWEGPFAFIADDYYFVAYSKPDMTDAQMDKTVVIDGFAMKDFRRWFIDENLKPGTMIAVVGRYTGKTEVLLANNQKTRVPLLVDCFIGPPINK